MSYDETTAALIRSERALEAELRTLRASHQRLKEALGNMIDYFQFTDESPGQYEAVVKAREALRSAP